MHISFRKKVCYGALTGATLVGGVLASGYQLFALYLLASLYPSAWLGAASAVVCLGAACYALFKQLRHANKSAQLLESAQVQTLEYRRLRRRLLQIVAALRAVSGVSTVRLLLLRARRAPAGLYRNPLGRDVLLFSAPFFSSLEKKHRALVVAHELRHSKALDAPLKLVMEIQKRALARLLPLTLVVCVPFYIWRSVAQDTTLAGVAGTFVHFGVVILTARLVISSLFAQTVEIRTDVLAARDLIEAGFVQDKEIVLLTESLDSRLVKHFRNYREAETSPVKSSMMDKIYFYVGLLYLEELRHPPERVRRAVLRFIYEE